MSVLAVLEARGGTWERISLETLAAAQQVAEDLGQTAEAAILGRDAGELAADLAARRLEKVWVVSHSLLTSYTADGWTAALEQLIACVAPSVVLFPHTYQVRDFLPKLATALNRLAVTDAIGHRVEDGRLVLVRQLFQGKLHADMRCTGEAPHLVSLQAGAYRAENVCPGAAPVGTFVPELAPARIRTLALEPFRDSGREVDLSAAPAIVAVGRGLKDGSSLPLVRQLAEALGAELGASRPVCDAGWLPMERQVGSSGQTVAPKLYVAVGISGAIQHIVGMKGSRVIVAINKDPDAPIFEIADYGVAGDLFEVLPALVEALRKNTA